MADPIPAVRLREGMGVERMLPAVSRSLQYVAVLVLVVIIGVAGQHLLKMRSALLADTERQLAQLDMVFAEQVGRTVEAVDLMLRDAIETVQTMRGAGAGSAALGEFLHRRGEGLRQVIAVDVTDSLGRVVASSSRSPDAPEPAGPVATLARYAAAPQADLRISEPFHEPDGSWTALMTRGVPAAGDGWDGMVVARLNLGFFEALYQPMELTDRGAIMLHRSDGIVLARYPHDATAIGAVWPPFRDILSRAGDGTALMDSPSDGRRVLAIRALKAFPLAVSVSVDEAMVLEPWRRQAILLAAVAVSVSIVIAALLLLLAQRSRQVKRLLAEFRRAQDRAELAAESLRDEIDERARAEAALDHAQRIEVVGQITGGIAHDFNNLLTVVLGNVDLLMRADKLAPPHSKWLATIRTAAERGAALTGQLLAFAKREPLLPAPMDINAVLDSMNDLMVSALGSRVRVVKRLQPRLWPVVIDPTQVEMAVLNLAINARDAMPDGGTLTITSANVTLGQPTCPDQPHAGEYVRLTVSDSGTGMTPAVLAKAFEPFFTTKGPGKGSGLGLPQVFGVTRQAGGGVEIETSPGTGTSVSMLLPHATLPLPTPAPPPSVPVGQHDGDVMVLLVDDDTAVRATTGELLRQLGYAVQEAVSGPAALEMLRGGLGAQIVLTDVAMPRMSGPALAHEIHEHWPRLPVVFFSGYAEPESVAGLGGLKRLLRKPFRPAELVAQLEAALTEHREVVVTAD